MLEVLGCYWGMVQALSRACKIRYDIFYMVKGGECCWLKLTIRPCRHPIHNGMIESQVEHRVWSLLRQRVVELMTNLFQCQQLIRRLHHGA